MRRRTSASATYSLNRAEAMRQREYAHIAALLQDGIKQAQRCLRLDVLEHQDLADAA
jgi:hypothetical protein